MTRLITEPHPRFPSHIYKLQTKLRSNLIVRVAMEPHPGGTGVIGGDGGGAGRDVRVGQVEQRREVDLLGHANAIRGQR
jgi:hypothetical protein